MLDTVDGKAGDLGELIGGGFAVPDGFVVTTDACRAVAGAGGRPDRPVPRARVAARARGALLAAEAPADVAVAIRDGYAGLGEGTGRRGAVLGDRGGPAVRQLRGPAGHLSARDRGGPDRVVDAVRRCWASLWTDRAVAYRAATGIDHRHVRLAVGVQRMVDAVAAGVLVHRQPGDRQAAADGDRRQPPAWGRRWSLARSIRTGSPSTPAPPTTWRAGSATSALRIAGQPVAAVRRGRWELLPGGDGDGGRPQAGVACGVGVHGRLVHGRPRFASARGGHYAENECPSRTTPLANTRWYNQWLWTRTCATCGTSGPSRRS